MRCYSKEGCILEFLSYLLNNEISTTIFRSYRIFRGKSLKNILLLCEAYGGGVKTYVDGISSNKDKLSNVQLIVLVSTKRLESNVLNSNNEFIIDNNLSFNKSFFKFIKALKTINKIVKEKDIHVIHANSSISGVLIFFYKVCFNSKVKFIYTPHGYFSFKSMGKIKKYLVKKVEKRINSICLKVIHVSKSEERMAVSNKIVNNKNSIVIYNGSQLPEKDEIKKLNGIFTIVNLARVDSQKNPFGFIEFAKFIIERNPSVQFVWAGSGEHLNSARKTVAELKLEHKIKFIGYLENKNDLLSNANLFFSTSFYEGLPFSVVEALSYKLPVLLSDIVGHQDLIIDNKNGLLFNFQDYEKVNNFITMLINDKEKYNYLSSNSFEIFKNHFSLDKMIKNIAELYETV